jgi:hypothetical protein
MYFTANVIAEEEINLIENGAEIEITNENKEEFIRLKSHFIAYKAIEQ